MASPPPRSSLLSVNSWVILVVHLLWFAALFHEMFNYWRMRKKMRIHARSPMLALLSGVASVQTHVIVMIQEMFAQEGSVLPCWMICYTNPITVTFYALPYLLRGVRVVIISDREWRAKYSMMLSRQNISILLTAVFLGMTGICTWLFKLSPQVYGPTPTAKCFILGDWWFFGPTSAVLAAVSSKLFIELARVQDRINMSKEISTAACSWLVTAVPFFSLIVLNYYKLCDSPRQTNFLLSLCMVLTNISTFFVEPRRHKGTLTWGKRKKVVVVCDEPHVAKWREMWHNSKVRQKVLLLVDGNNSVSLALMREELTRHNSKVIMDFPPLDQAFEKHVQDYLCSESYDFLKAVDKYNRSPPTLTAEELFELFHEIVDTYIVAGSELEINIETAMRNKIFKIADKQHFLVAEAEMRNNIFNPAGVEIRKMLDENLLKTFLVSTVFLNACKRAEEDADISASTEVRGKRSTLLLLDGGDPALEGELTMAQAAMRMERVGTLRRGTSLGRHR